MLVINREELAWAAGFFDGEGHTRYDLKPISKTGYLSISISQNNTKVLERFQRAVLGIGKIYGPDDHRMWAFKSTNYEHCQAIIAMLWPFLSEIKRDQAHAALIMARDNWKMNPKTSRYRGVSYNSKTRNKWRAGIQIAGRWTELGYFPTEEEAHQARLKAEHDYHNMAGS